MSKFNVLPIRRVFMTIGAYALIVIRRLAARMTRRTVNATD